MNPKPRRPLAFRVVLFCFALGMIGVPLAAGAALYLAFDGVIDSAMTFLSTPSLTPSSQPAPEWSGKSRINFLLLGTDQRDGEKDPPRTDTIIVLTLDPESRSAGVLSLPRDLWVSIPGYDNERINAAYELGEQQKKGGGPELARKTVEELLGVPIHHYALIGFAGFEKLVDHVGGVVVDVERPIKDNEYPDQNYSLRRIFFQPGLQRLDGETALWYVRTRHADSDFGRARRQQQFLLALRKQALQLNMLPKAPAILSSLADSVKTDLRPQEILSLAKLAMDVDLSRVANRVVDESMTSHWVTPAGAQVELPDKAALRKVVQEVFGK
ncbi:MAG: LCP family protein [Chloroflexi bacterium]|nr:LCP family protein [Chloroflexota bacterium]